MVMMIPKVLPIPFPQQSSTINRRRDLFDIPSYAGSIDEELPPYEGFSLPKYHHIINENISSNGGDQGSIASPQETIQMNVLHRLT
ncbi:13673_t:CDS:2 [Funneliformis caledonium]|uniref:13673_t:CDS:1 n=1 Tax=Funneliformis caledonium TaxID=1117310 RepID=A0A9N9C8R8_9GLOM|nr:13673_t:CDS:2 [Funneliformis caledonium]